MPIHHSKQLVDNAKGSRLKGVHSALTVFDDFSDEFLNRRAKATGTVDRWRKIRDARTLLRLAMVWAVLRDMSLRTTSSWALKQLHLDISAKALSKRFIKMEPFLHSLIAKAEQVEEATDECRVVMRIVDGSTLCLPGAEGIDYRWHVAYDPVRGRMTSSTLTDQSGSEHFGRTRVHHVDVMMGDCYYGKASQFVMAEQRHCECLCRVYLPQIKLLDTQGQRVDPEYLRSREGETPRPQSVRVNIPFDNSMMEARLLVCPLPEEQANRARQKLRKRYRKDGKTPSAERLWLARYWFMLTTLDCELIDPQLAADLYRIRWQIEIFFKRAKSLHGLSRIRRARPALERVQIQLMVLFLMMLQRHLVADWNSWYIEPSRTDCNPPMPSSLWRQAVMLHKELVICLYGPLTRVGLNKKERRRLAEAPRQRRYSCEALGVFSEAIIPAPRTLSIGGTCPHIT